MCREKGDEIEEWARAWQLLMDAYNEECERLRMAHEAAEQPVVDELNRMKVKSSFSVYESQLEVQASGSGGGRPLTGGDVVEGL